LNCPYDSQCRRAFLYGDTVKALATSLVDERVTQENMNDLKKWFQNKAGHEKMTHLSVAWLWGKQISDICFR